MEAPASLACAENIALLHLLHAGRGKDGALFMDSVPARPSVCPAKGSPIHPKDYVLSFERERSLAGALAFISSIKDDSDHIPAICIEEDHCTGAKSSLRILLAVNRSKWSDGHEVIQKVTTGFNGIFAALSEVTDGNDDQAGIEHEVRKMIVSMCSDKIRSRLHFITPRRKTPKQPAKEKFQNVIRALAPLGTTTLSKLVTVSNGKRDLFIEGAKEVLMLINAWWNHQTLQQLADLVDGIFRLRKLDCQAVLNSIPNDRFNRDAKKSILNMILKVARYSEAARFLVCTSRRFPIARHMQVVPVSLSEDAFFRTPVDFQYEVGLSSLLSRINPPKKTSLLEQKSQTETVCRLLGTSPNKADSDLTGQARRTLSSGKVHAEVQLVCYYDLRDKLRFPKESLLPPRVVCSSKKACFLCNLFVVMHSKMRTPWCHGKLYPGWRLPRCSGPALQLRFNQIIEVRIRESIAIMFKRREKTSYPGPSESTLITLSSLASAPKSVLAPKHDGNFKVLSDVKHAQEIQGGKENVDDDDAGDNRGLIPSSGPLPATVGLRPTAGQVFGEVNQRFKSGSESHHGRSHFPCRIETMADGGSQRTERVIQDQSSYDDLDQEAQAAQSSSSPEDHAESIKEGCPIAQSQDGDDVADDPIYCTKSSNMGEQSLKPPTTCEESDNPLQEYYHLRRGQKLSHIIRPKHTSTFYTRSLVAQVEYSTGWGLEAAAEREAHKLPVTIDRLEVDEIARLRDHGIVPIVDAEAMAGESPIFPPSIGHLYISASGDMFKITFH